MIAIARRVIFFLPFALVFPPFLYSQDAPLTNFSTPMSPTLSPYLGLLRRDGGVLPNYYQFVRPQQQLQQNIAAQARTIEQQRRELSSVQRRVNDLKDRQIPSTGVRGGFMRYSHFYPAFQPR